MNTITQLIAHIHRQDFQYRAAKFEPLGLKACHGKYLKVICDNPGICQEELTAHMVVNKSNIARQVAALEEAGFVERRSCTQDKRKIRLYPTEKTLALRHEILDVMDSWQAHLLQDLTPEDQQMLVSLLEKIRDRAMEEKED